MKPTARLLSAARLSLPLATAIVALLSHTHAQAATWNQTATGTYNWDTNANWTLPATFPNAIGATANLNIDIAGAQTINLNTGITLGILNIGDSTGSSGAQTVATGTAGSLTFNNGGTSQLNHGTSTAVDTISAQITLADNLQITNSGATAGKNNAFTLSGKITGTGSITLNAGNGFVYLSNTTNDYSGGFTLNSGATVLTGGNSNAFGTGTLTINGGTINTAFTGAASQVITTSNANVWNGNWTLASDTSSKVITFNGGVTLGANVAVTANQFLVLNNNVSDSGSNRVLTMNGTGSMTLNGTNTYGGGTNITSGTLQFGKLASMPATGTVAVTAAGLYVNLGGTGEWTTGTSGAGTLGGLIAASAVGGQGNTVTWSGASAVGLDTSNAPSAQTYSNGIANRGTSLGVTKLGNGSLTISGTNAYTGTTTVNGGTLNMSGTFGNTAITVNGGLLNFTSTSGGSGAITIAGGTFLYAGTKTAGSVTNNAGTLQIGTATTTGLGQITIGSASYATISSDSTTARTITNRFVMNGNIVLGDAVNNGKLTFSDAGATSTTGSAARPVTVLSDAEFTTGLTGTGGITKAGAATLTLSGASSNYSSTTQVNGGLFALGNGGNLTGATNVTVTGPGTFGIRQNASGTTNSVGATASTFTLAAGSALSMADGFYSTLNLPSAGAVSLAPATGTAPVITFDLIGANKDVLAITGAATAGAAGAKIAISPSSTPNAGSSYTIITGGVSSALSTNFALANSLLPTANGLMSLSLSTSTATATTVSVTNASNAAYWAGGSSPNLSNSANLFDAFSGGSTVAPASKDLVFSYSSGGSFLASPSTSSAALTVNSVNFLPGVGATAISGSNTLTVNTNINDNSSTNQTFTAALAVTGNINKTGSGTLTLAGANTISGTTTLDAGTLLLSNANAITSTSGITTTASAVSLATGTTIQLRGNGNTTFNTGQITLQNGQVNIDVDNNGSGSGNTLTLGTASISSANTTAAIITAANASTVLNVTGGNSYKLSLGRIQQPTNVSGVAFTVNAGTVPVAISQFQTGSFGNNFIVGSGTVNLSQLSQGSNGGNTLTVNSGGTLILGGATTSYNTRAGGTLSTVLNSGGTLVVNNAGALANSGTGTNAPTFIINGGTLDSTQSGGITITAGTLTTPNITWNGDFTFTGSQSLNLSNGAVTMVGNRAVTVTANTLTMGGAISGAGLTKSGNGTLFLSGASTYSGTTTVSAGVLQINNATALGSTASGTTVSSGATLGYASGSTLTVVGEALSLNGTGSSGTNGALYVGGGASTFGWQGAITLTGNTLMHADGSAAFSLSSAATIDMGGNTLTVDLDGSAPSTFAGIISNGSLTKSSTSTLNLTNANNYSGATTIKAGTLALGASGSFANSPTIVVGNTGSSGAVLDLTAKSSFSIGSGQTVKGIGTINIGSGKTVTISGTLSPGNSIGTINETGNLTLAGTYSVELGTVNANPALSLSDRTAVTGGLTAGGNLTLVDNANANIQGSMGAGAYRIATYTTTLSGTFSSVTNPLSSTLHEKVVYGPASGGGSVDLNLYRLATGSTSAVALGKARVGDSLSGNLTTSNSAAADGFSEKLNASVGSNTGDVNSSSGSVSGVIAGASSSTINVGLSTTTSGSKSGSVLVSYVSDGTGTSGYSTTSNGSQTVGVSGTVYDYAVTAFTQTGGDGALSGGGNSYTLDFGTGLALNTWYTANIQLANSVFMNALYQDDLGGSYSNIASGEFASGVEGTSFANLVAGTNNSFTITFYTGSAGTFGDTLTFSGLSQQSGLSDANLGDYNITLSAIAVPEPRAALLGGLGLLALLRRRRA